MLRINVAHCFLGGHKPLIYKDLWFFLVVMDGNEPTPKNRIYDIVEAPFELNLEHNVFHIGVFGRGSDVSNFDTNLVGN